MNEIRQRVIVLQDIADERLRQEAKWGTEVDLLWSHVQVLRTDLTSLEEKALAIKLYLWLKNTILGEEVGEVSRAILERNYENLYTELVQSAAVCTAIAELLLEEGYATRNGTVYSGG